MDIKEVRNELLKLHKIIDGGDIQISDEEWGGADVVITKQKPKDDYVETFYPSPRYVVTNYSHELSWLFYKLRDIFSKFLDGTNKIEFFGRLANSANYYLINSNKPNLKDLLNSVLHEAFSIQEEIEEGTFFALPIAIGNQIYKELEEGENSGYLGIKETKEFFEEMKRRYKDE